MGIESVHYSPIVVHICEICLQVLHCFRGHVVLKFKLVSETKRNTPTGIEKETYDNLESNEQLRLHKKRAWCSNDVEITNSN